MKFSNNRNDGFKRFQKPIPVKEGETYEVTIESIGEKGDGIAKVEGYVIVVPNTKKGEKVMIKVNAVRGKVSFGEVVERMGETDSKERENEEEKEEDNEDTGSEDEEMKEDSQDEENEEEINKEEEEK